jgi:isohexenylglutaconyl-CoA hydratase
MSEGEAPVLVAREGGIVRMTLNRPARRNAMNGAMMAALDEVLDGLEKDSSARVVVLSGAGGHFCAGLDLTEVGQQPTLEERIKQGLERNRKTGERFVRLSSLPQVVIAAIQGSAHAGGLGWVCSADIAFATADARFAAPEVRRGLVAAQILPWMVRRMGRSVAARMVLEGNVIDSAEAARIGLVHEVVADAAALDTKVAATVKAILQGAPSALAETKKLIAALGAVSPPGYADAGAQAFARGAASPEAAEGIAAFKEKRPPSWAV